MGSLDKGFEQDRVMKTNPFGTTTTTTLKVEPII